MNTARKRVVRQRDDELTQLALLERSARQITEAVMVAVKAASARERWYDQDNSPLGHDRHLKLARQKKFASIKEGKKVLVHANDMDAYIRTQGLSRGPDQPEPEQAEVDDILKTVVGGARNE